MRLFLAREIMRLVQVKQLTKQLFFEKDILWIKLTELIQKMNNKNRFRTIKSNTIS